VGEKLVSVVIPSFNHRAFVGAAIESVLAQSYSPLELIVVDDGSTDGSAAWIEQNYGGKIKKLIAAPHRGAHAAINEGIRNAAGRYVAILNSDDVYAPERIAKLVGAAESGGFDLVFSDVEFIGETGKPIPRHKAALGYKKALDRLARLPIEEALLRQNFTIASSNLLARREVFEHVGMFRGFKLCHDWDFLLRCIGRAKIARVPEPLLGYRLHRGNTISGAEPWLAPAECALVYVSYFLEKDAASSAPAGFLFDAEPFEPLIVGWMLAEARRVGLEQLIVEAEAGGLHRRLQADFERNGFGFAARLSPRRMKKKMSGGWRALLK
jgi:glycosyltransferase involved in cell wall biosynthesis